MVYKAFPKWQSFLIMTEHFAGVIPVCLAEGKMEKLEKAEQYIPN